MIVWDNAGALATLGAVRVGSRALWLASALGCSGLSSGQDTASEGPMLEPNWDCLDTPSRLIRMAVPEPTQLRVINLLNMSPVTGLTVRACGLLDANCTSPIATAVSAEAPLHSIAVGPDFAGAFRLEAPGYIDSVRFAELDLSVDRRDGSFAREFLHVMLTATDLVEMAADLAVPNPALVPQMAQFTAPIQDCNGNPGDGAEMFIARDQHPGAVGWSIRDGLPQIGAVVGAVGAGGFLLVPNSTMTVCGRYKGREFGGVSVRMREGQSTTAAIRAGFPCDY